MITAIILIDAESHAIPETAAALANLEGVDEVYSCAGDVDLIAKIRVRDHEKVADLVTGVINRVPGVKETRTHIAFKTYAQSDVESAFAIGG